MDSDKFQKVQLLCCILPAYLWVEPCRKKIEYERIELEMKKHEF